MKRTKYVLSAITNYIVLYCTLKGENLTSNLENNIFEKDNHRERIYFNTRKTDIRYFDSK